MTAIQSSAPAARPMLVALCRRLLMTTAHLTQPSPSPLTRCRSLPRLARRSALCAPSRPCGSESSIAVVSTSQNTHETGRDVPASVRNSDRPPRTLWHAASRSPSTLDSDPAHSLRTFSGGRCPARAKTMTRAGRSSFAESALAETMSHTRCSASSSGRSRSSACGGQSNRGAADGTGGVSACPFPSPLHAFLTRTATA